MEDYAPILWLLFVVASMIFSAISKARKRTARDAKEPDGAQPGEGKGPRPTVPRFPTPGSGLPEGFPLPQRRSSQPASATSPASRDGSPSQPPTYRNGQNSGKRIPTHETAPKQALGGTETYPTRGRGPEHASEGLQRRHSTVSAAQPQVTAAMHEKRPVEPSKTGEPASEIAAEFDLRKAVIYAEILKPKFEE